MGDRTTAVLQQMRGREPSHLDVIGQHTMTTNLWMIVAIDHDEAFAGVGELPQQVFVPRGVRRREDEAVDLTLPQRFELARMAPNAAETVHEACTGRTYLAWFNGLLNAGIGPRERRPDLAQLVDLELQTSVPGGQLYLLKPLDPSTCGQG